MPLYSLTVIATHVAKFSPIKSLVMTTSALVVNNGGVVRQIDYHGLRNLPQIMKQKGGESHNIGDYWTLQFDANPPTVAALNERLRLDPRVIRHTTLKLASTLRDITALTTTTDPTTKYSRSLPPRTVTPKIGAEILQERGSDPIGRRLPGSRW